MTASHRASVMNTMTNGSSSVVSTIPAATVTGDFMIFVATFGNAGTFSTPSGWTAIAAGVQTTTSATHQAWYRIAQAGDASATVTTNFTGSTGRGLGTIYVAQGAHASSPLDSSAAHPETSSTLNHVCPTVSVTAANCLLVAVLVEKSATVTTFTDPGGYTRRQSSVSAISGQSDGWLGENASIGTGTQGGATIATDVASTNACTFVFAVAPAVVAQPFTWAYSVRVG